MKMVAPSAAGRKKIGLLFTSLIIKPPLSNVVGGLFYISIQLVSLRKRDKAGLSFINTWLAFGEFYAVVLLANWLSQWGMGLGLLAVGTYLDWVASVADLLSVARSRGKEKGISGSVIFHDSL